METNAHTTTSTMHLMADALLDSGNGPPEELMAEPGSSIATIALDGTQ